MFERALVAAPEFADAITPVLAAARAGKFPSKAPPGAAAAQRVSISGVPSAPMLSVALAMRGTTRRPFICTQSMPRTSGSLNGGWMSQASTTTMWRSAMTQALTA
jgi:hypothetical protein